MKILSLITLENGVKMTFEVKQNHSKEYRLWFDMDEPTDKDMLLTIYEVPNDNITIGKCKETTFHQSSLRCQHMLLPGSYIFTFSNDQYTQLSVVLNHKTLSLGEY